MLIMVILPLSTAKSMACDMVEEKREIPADEKEYRNGPEHYFLLPDTHFRLFKGREAENIRTYIHAKQRSGKQ
ncbi:MAG: hypothetical protein LBQ88_06315 [Treponema sp.]|nr:hypothetical protein [Treponema sp.]